MKPSRAILIWYRPVGSAASTALPPSSVVNVRRTPVESAAMVPDALTGAGVVHHPHTQLTDAALRREDRRHEHQHAAEEPLHAVASAPGQGDHFLPNRRLYGRRCPAMASAMSAANIGGPVPSLRNSIDENELVAVWKFRIMNSAAMAATLV